MEQYPIMRANDDLASISFTLSDGTALTVPGTSTAAPQSASIANPFLHSRSDALACARWILQFYGGNRLETSGRGDPSSEIGDIDVVWLDENTATNGRRMSQGFTFTGGVLKSCPSVLLQADGVFEYENREVLTASGTWQAPAGVSKLVVMLVGGGQGGQNGQDGQGVNISGFRGQDGANGADGVPGKVWYGTININEAQTFQVVIGGGTDAAPYGQLPPKGGDTSFGAYTSAAGRVYSDGYSDIRDGAVFGAQSRYPPTNSGYGALGGTGGKAGTAHFEWVRESVWDPDGNPTGWDVGPVIIDSEPTPGQTAQRGADGCVVIYWDKPSES